MSLIAMAFFQNAVAGMLLMIHMRSSSSPNVRCTSSDANNARIVALPHLTRAYWPHAVISSWWGPLSGWASSITALMRLPPSSPSARSIQMLKLDDGGTVGLDWFSGVDGIPPNSKIAILFPGLGNDSQTHLIQQTASRLHKQGIYPVTVNYRGVLGDLTSHRIGCMDSWRDVDAIVTHIVNLHQPREIVAVAWSMGGVILTRYLGEGSDASKHITAAVTLSAPLDTKAQQEWMKADVMGRITDFVLGSVFMMKALVSRGMIQNLQSMGVSLSDVMKIRGIRDVDRYIICPIHKYPDVEDYYIDNNPAPFLGNIQIPLLAVHAADDPVTPLQCLPLASLAENPDITFAVTKFGGHMGWTSASVLPLQSSWADDLTLRFFQHEEGVRNRKLGLHTRSRL